MQAEKDAQEKQKQDEKARKEQEKQDKAQGKADQQEARQRSRFWKTLATAVLVPVARQVVNSLFKKKR